MGLLLLRLKAFFMRHLTRMGGFALTTSIMVYVVVTWLGLYLCGETALIQPNDFIYFLVVTASTVGYGDMSPESAAGRWFAALWIIPIGLSLFVTIVTKVGMVLAALWRGGIMGEKALVLENHILVIGWDERESTRLLSLLVREENDRVNPRTVSLCVTEDIANPLPGEIEFVRVASYTDSSLVERTSLDKASCVIVDAESDHETLAIALFVNTVNQQANLAVYFKDSEMAPLLSSVCPQAEVIPSVAVEMLAKSASDPGSSALHRELLDVAFEQTQYSAQMPEHLVGQPVELLFNALKLKNDATLIGIKQSGERDVHVNPALDHIIEAHTQFFYIADDRITQFNWN